jgi:general secretion pathway protein M
MGAVMDVATGPGWGQRLAALALLLLAGGALYLAVDQVLVGRYRYYQNALEQHQGRLAQLERMAATREPVQQLIAKIQQDRNVTAQYLPQSAPALAAAELQQRIKAVVEAAGGTLQSTQALPPVEEGGAVKVAISATMNGDTGSLQKVLYDLESQTPLLFVDNVELSARATRPRLPSGRFATYTRTQLNVQFEVSGYLRKEGG